MADKGERPQQADDAFRNALRARLEANSFGLRLEDLMGRTRLITDWRRARGIREDLTGMGPGHAPAAPLAIEEVLNEL